MVLYDVVCVLMCNDGVVVRMEYILTFTGSSWETWLFVKPANEPFPPLRNLTAAAGSIPSPNADAALVQGSSAAKASAKAVMRTSSRRDATWFPGEC